MYKQEINSDKTVYTQLINYNFCRTCLVTPVTIYCIARCCANMVKNFVYKTQHKKDVYHIYSKASIRVYVTTGSSNGILLVNYLGTLAYDLQ